MDKTKLDIAEGSWVRLCDLGDRYSHIAPNYIVSKYFSSEVFDLKTNNWVKSAEQSTRLGKVRYTLKQKNGKNTSVQISILRKLCQNYHGNTFTLDELR